MKAVYDLVPFKRAIFLLLRSIWSVPSRLSRHLNFTGEFTLLIETKKIKMIHYGYLIENLLFWGGPLGSYEKISLKYWMKLCHKCNYIHDVGANTGIYALIAKGLNPDAEVVAYEPVPRVFQKLNRNIEVNHFDIRSYQVGLSDYDGVATIYDTDTDHIYSVTVNANLHDEGVNVIQKEIKVSRFDTLFEKESFGGLDLIKIDVETHEPEVLKGIGALLGQYRPTMFIEVLTPSVADQLMELLDGSGYLYYQIDEINEPIQVDVICPKTDPNTKTSDSEANYMICHSDVANYLGLIL